MITYDIQICAGHAGACKSQHEYAKRVRDVTAQRVTQFSEVFRQLARSFGQIDGDDETSGGKKQIGHFMNAAAEKTCAPVIEGNACWEGKFYQTYRMMTEHDDDGGGGTAHRAEGGARESGASIASKPHQVLTVMQQQYELYQHDQLWRKQLSDSRHLVADQLSGVSQVMEDLAREIQREGQELHLQEEQIREALEGLGLSIHGIEVINLEEGNVEIEMYHTFTQGFDECRKIIAPLLTDILGEPIAVMSEQLPEKDGEADAGRVRLRQGVRGGDRRGRRGQGRRSAVG